MAAHAYVDSKACEEMLLNSLRDHRSLSKPEVVELLWNVLPDLLTNEQKHNRINNMLSKLRINGKIYCKARGNISIWYISN